LQVATLHAASPAQMKKQVPCYYRMQLSAFEITAFDDGRVVANDARY
jgi:hypothetical protein